MMILRIVGMVTFTKKVFVFLRFHSDMGRRKRPIFTNVTAAILSRNRKVTNFSIRPFFES